VSFLVISNGVGRKPHVEELDSRDDVIARLETDRESCIVIEGRLIDHHEERFLVLDDHTTPLNPKPEGGADAGTIIPRWPATVTGEAEHIPVVGEHPEGQQDDPPSGGVSKGPDESGIRTAVDGSTDVDGESQRSSPVVPPEEQAPEG